MTTAPVTSQEWNRLVAALPHTHPLQTWEWGQFKAQVGWQPLPQIWRDDQGRVIGAALVLERRISIRGFSARLSVLYVPRGPVGDWSNPQMRQTAIRELSQLARRRKAIFIKIDPDVRLGTGFPSQPEAQDDPTGLALVTELHQSGWVLSDEQIQFRNTVLVDLRQSEAQILANMKQKTRYNLRLAERKGVTARLAQEADLPALYQMYAETSVRDGFVIRDRVYYLDLWSRFQRAGLADIWLAEVGQEIVAGVVILRFGGLAIYLNGMSRLAHREKMPNHLLQWQAMQQARRCGCHTYDLWGAPEVFSESDPLWGVYRFKEGFGGQVVRTLGAWDFPSQPNWYWMYSRVLPTALAWMRRGGKKRVQRLVGA